MADTPRHPEVSWSPGLRASRELAAARVAVAARTCFMYDARRSRTVLSRIYVNRYVCVSCVLKRETLRSLTVRALVRTYPAF